ncbi:MAG: hypothetical protein WCC06_05595 [Candidatus Aminicenantales bacterium]
MKAKEIIFAILIILAGILFYSVQTGKLDFDFFWDGDFFHWDHEEFVYEESQEIPAPVPHELEVINAHGHVEIQGTESEKVTVSFTKRVHHRNEEDAKNISDRLQMVINQDEAKLVISTNRDNFRRKPFETDFKISVPAGIKVLVKNSYGMVYISRTGPTDIKNPYGEVFAMDISGSLTVQNSYEDVEVHNVESRCQIESRYSTVKVFSVKGETLIQHKYGEVALEDTAQNVTVEGNYSKVTGKNLSGRLEVESSYKNIFLSNVGPTKLKCNHCDIEINGAKERLEIKNDYGRADVNNIQGDCHIEGKDLKVFGHSIIGNEISIFSSYENIELNQFSGQTTISLSHGNATLEPLPLTDPVEVKAVYSTIRLYWPAGEKYPVEARSKGGNIRWELEKESLVKETNGTTTLKAYAEEKDKPSIILSTTYGDILIERISKAEKMI